MLEGVVGARRHRADGGDPRRRRRGEDGNDQQLRRRMVRRLDAAVDDAVWVGYPQGAIPMETNYNGAPVEGGTFPAIIWHNFMVQALQILANEQAEYGPHKAGQTATTLTTQSLIPSTGGGPYTTPGAATTPANTTGGATAPGATTTPGAATTTCRHHAGQHRRRHKHAGPRQPRPPPARHQSAGTEATPAAPAELVQAAGSGPGTAGPDPPHVSTRASSRPDRSLNRDRAQTGARSLTPNRTRTGTGCRVQQNRHGRSTALVMPIRVETR